MAEKLIPFDAADYLDSDEAIAEYLTAALEADDADVLIKALGTITRAKGMTAIAEQTGLGRESLYKALKQGANPRFATVMKVFQALGMSMSVSPSHGR